MNLCRVSLRPDVGARDVATGHVPDLMRVLTRNQAITVECSKCYGSTHKRQLTQTGESEKASQESSNVLEPALTGSQDHVLNFQEFCKPVIKQSDY